MASISASYNKEWVYIYCAHDEALSSSYLYALFGTTVTGMELYKTHTVGAVDPSSFNIYVMPFNGHLSNIRYFSELIDPNLALKLSRQRLNKLNTVYELIF